MNNAQIAAAFEELADLYELDGAVQYRVLAYRTAAKAVRESSVSVMQMVRDGKVTEIPGIGKTLESKLVALDETGQIPQAVKLREKFPPGLIAITHLPGFGPKRARRLYDELGVDSLESLRAACERQEVRKLRGFGAKVEEQLLEALAAGADGTPAPRILLSRALPVAQQIAEALRAAPGAHRVEVAGSLRRQVDSVKDLDVIATADDAAALVEALEGAPGRRGRAAVGPAGARATTHAGLKVDLKVVAPDQFGNVLQHFTGSKDHNVQLREAAVRKGLHVSEYGILDDATGETVRCATEEEVYATLGLPYIEPELREGRGELEAALKDELPRARHARGPPRRPALAHDALRRQPGHGEDGRGRAQARLRVPRHHRPLGEPRLRQPRRRRDARAADRARARAQRVVRRRLRAADRDRDEHPPGRLAGLPGRAAGRARLGRGQRPHRRSACPPTT